MTLSLSAHLENDLTFDLKRTYLQNMIDLKNVQLVGI